jgi:Tol biopolymer transport system component
MQTKRFCVIMRLPNGVLNLPVCVLLSALLAFGGVPPTAALTGNTVLVSIASDGTQANGESYEPALSADGRYVAFDSVASNLVSGDSNGYADVFVHDQQTGETSRVSVASDGTQANEISSSASISGDGRYVAFHSFASNLVSSDTNGWADIFVHDQQTGEISLVSVASDGTQGTLWSYTPSISADGRYVAFYSLSSNLVNEDTNGNGDIFVHDLQTGETSRVSVSSSGIEGNWEADEPSISADGRYVAFESSSWNLVVEDTNGKFDIFVHDRQTGDTTRVSVASDGAQANGESHLPAISADGRYVAFLSDADNLVSGDSNGKTDVFVHDRQTGETSRVSVASDGTQANGTAYHVSMSATARYVTFDSDATNLVSDPANGDVFVHDRLTGQTTCVDVAFDGAQANSWSWQPAISATGRYVAFKSDASNLVSDDTNHIPDIFVREQWTIKQRVFLPIVRK